jgi:hypothetical protein
MCYFLRLGGSEIECDLFLLRNSESKQYRTLLAWTKLSYSTHESDRSYWYRTDGRNIFKNFLSISHSNDKVSILSREKVRYLYSTSVLSNLESGSEKLRFLESNLGNPGNEKLYLEKENKMIKVPNRLF